MPSNHQNWKLQQRRQAMRLRLHHCQQNRATFRPSSRPFHFWSLWRSERENSCRVRVGKLEVPEASGPNYSWHLIFSVLLVGFFQLAWFLVLIPIMPFFILYEILFKPQYCEQYRNKLIMKPLLFLRKLLLKKCLSSAWMALQSVVWIYIIVMAPLWALSWWAHFYWYVKKIPRKHGDQLERQGSSRKNCRHFTKDKSASVKENTFQSQTQK